MDREGLDKEVPLGDYGGKEGDMNAITGIVNGTLLGVLVWALLLVVVML